MRISGSNPKIKIGLNEVAIGLPLPVYGTEFARARLSTTYLSRVLCQAWVMGVEDARSVGFLDEVTEHTGGEAVIAHAVARAQQLAGTLKHPAFHLTKLKERQV